MLEIKDKYGSVLHIKQAKNGEIIIPFANDFLTLSYEDSQKVGTLYEIPEFDVDAYNKAYNK